jgi:hypothetical protein
MRFVTYIFVGGVGGGDLQMINILSKIHDINDYKTTKKNFYVIFISLIILRTNVTSVRICFHLYLRTTWRYESLRKSMLPGRLLPEYVRHLAETCTHRDFKSVHS